MSEVFSWNDIPRAHTKMMNNQHKARTTWPFWVQANRPWRPDNWKTQVED